MQWYVIHTKPQQEKRALFNLEQQGYACYLPVLSVEKLQRNLLLITEEALFARYLFIYLDDSQSGKGWAPIRSTLGVNRMVSFGVEPAKVSENLIATLRTQLENVDKQPKSLFTKGECLVITQGPFNGLEAIYQMPDGESRAMVLINLLNKSVRLKIAPANLRKVNG